MASSKSTYLRFLTRLCAKIAQLTEARDDMIRAAVKAGHSNVEIAEATGLTRQRVWQIVREVDS